VLALGLLGGRLGLVAAVIALVITGIVAGLLLIPLNASLQHESHQGQLGKTIAVQNFVDYVSMLAGAGFLQLMTFFHLAPSGVFVALAFALVALASVLRFRSAAVPS
jgi:LPLT family lysophospholipid transporter-like MFS transporter